MPKMKPMLSIIIPAYNEERRIGKTLRDLSDFFSRKNVSYEILVIMDGCTDGTERIVDEHSRRDSNVRYLVYPEKQGKGGALLQGFKHVRGDYVAYTDADGATPPGEIYRLAGLMRGYDGVIGSRWLKGSIVVRKQRPTRRIASRGFNIMTRLVLGLPYRDTQCPAKVFKKSVIDDVIQELRVTDFAMDACMLFIMKRKGYKVREIPIRWEDRPLSSLRMSKTVLGMFRTLIKTRLG